MRAIRAVLALASRSCAESQSWAGVPYTLADRRAASDAVAWLFVQGTFFLLQEEFSFSEPLGWWVSLLLVTWYGWSVLFPHD